MPRRFLLFGVTAVAIAGLSVWLSPRPKWNVLLITLDTTRADHIGCYGNRQAMTPALDALAESGVFFEKAYSTVPLTLPSHATLLTGLYPAEHGLRDNGTGRLDKRIPTLAAVLRNEGYDTGAFIASFVLHSKFGLDQRFQKYDDDMAGGSGSPHEMLLSRNARQVADAALAWLDVHQAQPFFCWVHLYDPHAPFDAHEEEFGDRFRDSPYDGDIAFADRQIGRLLEFLRVKRLDERTLVVVVGDHGEGLGEHLEREHGLTLYNASLQVPLIMACPGLFRSGLRIASPVSLVDVAPTVLDCVRAPAITAASGVTLRPALQGAPAAPRLCYSETDAPFLTYGWSPLRSLTTETWKYVRTTREELYDLRHDPHELDNLAKSQPAQLDTMRMLLVGIEGRMAAHDGGHVQLTESEQRKLESLGYLTGRKSSSAPANAEPLPDVKDRLACYNAESEAQALVDRGEFEKAEAMMREAVKDAPEFIPARMTLAVALEEQNRPDESFDVLEAALKIRPDSHELQFQLAQLCSEQGKPDAAIAHYTEALNLSPEFATARVNLANILLQQGEVEQAFRHYEQALDDSPDSIAAHFCLGTALARRGDFTAALRHLARAVELYPEEAEMQFELGCVFAAQGRFDDAVHHLELAVRLNPDHLQAAAQLVKARTGLRRKGGEQVTPDKPNSPASKGSRAAVSRQ